MQRMRADIVDGVLGEILSVNACAHLACWSHVIDLVQWWLGEIVTVSALISTRGERLDRICTVSFPTGVVGSLEGAAGIFERKSLLRVQVRGSLARGVVEGVNGSYRRLRESSDARSRNGRALTSPEIIIRIPSRAQSAVIALRCERELRHLLAPMTAFPNSRSRLPSTVRQRVAVRYR